jgi:hypothetical protein
MMDNYIHKMIRVHPDTFKATVNTAIIICERNRSKSFNQDHVCQMVDMTNVSVHDSYSRFVELLGMARGVDFGVVRDCVSNEEYGIYYYPQGLIQTNSNLPFFVAGPKLFALMNDSSKELKQQVKVISKKTVQVKTLIINERQIEIVKLGDVGAAPHGISTGDNKKYVRAKLGTKGSYDLIEDWMICTQEEIEKLTEQEKIHGLNKEWTKLKECFVPFEKGGESDSDDGGCN